MTLNIPLRDRLFLTVSCSWDTVCANDCTDHRKMKTIGISFLILNNLIWFMTSE